MSDSLKEKLSEGQYGHIARKTGYTRPHVSRVLRGLRGWTDTFVRTLAHVIGEPFLEVVKYLQVEWNKEENVGKRAETDETRIEKRLLRLERRSNENI